MFLQEAPLHEELHPSEPVRVVHAASRRRDDQRRAAVLGRGNHRLQHAAVAGEARAFVHLPPDLHLTWSYAVEHESYSRYRDRCCCCCCCRWAVRPAWCSSTTPSWLTSSGCWWRVSTCTHCCSSSTTPPSASPSTCSSAGVGCSHDRRHKYSLFHQNVSSFQYFKKTSMLQNILKEV